MDKPMFCRCCLSSNDLQSLFTPCDTPEKVMTYADIIKRCFFLEMWSPEDNDPLICSPCVQRIRDAHQFRAQIQLIQDLLSNGTVVLSQDGRVVIQKRENIEDIEMEHDIGNNGELNNGTDFDCTDSNDMQSLRKNNISRHQIACGIAMEKNKQIKSNSIAKSHGQNKNAKEIETSENPKETKSKKEIRDIELLSCDKCQLKFTTRTYLDNHMTKHCTNYICDYCGERFSAKLRLKQHLIRHIHRNDPCKICGKVLQNPNNMKRHLDIHAGIRPPLRCRKCFKEFKTYYSRQKHLGEVHNVDVYTFKCDSCDIAFCVSGKLRAHIRRVHLNLKPFACSECPLAFYNSNCLKTHMLKHTGEKNYKCEVCEKSYARRFTLNEHMRIHNNDKRFTCQKCGRSFTQKCTLEGHLRTHAKQNDRIDDQSDLSNSKKFQP